MNEKKPSQEAIGEPSCEQQPRWSRPPQISFDALARCGSKVWIEHRGMLYRLQRARQGKLLLTK